MLAIQEKAIKYVKKENESFLVKRHSNSVTCWSGTTTTVAGLRIETVKDFINNEDFYEYEYEDVKVYVDSSLTVKDNAYIFMLPKLPFVKPFFDAQGIEAKK